MPAARQRVSLRAGASPAKATVKAAVDGFPEWEGTLYVSGLHINAPGAIMLTSTQRGLLQMLYWGMDRLQILDEFGGGYSNSRVLKVQAFDSHRPCLPQIVKMERATG